MHDFNLASQITFFFLFQKYGNANKVVSRIVYGYKLFLGSFFFPLKLLHTWSGSTLIILPNLIELPAERKKAGEKAAAERLAPAFLIAQ